MTEKATKKLAMEMAVELTGKALTSNDKINQVVHPEDTAAYIETVFRKVCDLLDSEDA